MKKIIVSVLAIVLTLGVVSGTAYALFSTTATVSGITISSGNANLVIYDGGTWIPINTFVVFLNTRLANLYPGFKDFTNVDFVNTSTSNIGLGLKMQLTSTGGSWGDLKDKIYIAVTPQGTVPTTEWHTLAEWNANPIPFGVTLAHDNLRDSYRFSFAVADNADNDIANKTLTDVTFVVTGTQQ